MKKLLLMIVVLTAGSVWADQTNVSNTIKTEVTPRSGETLIVVKQKPANQAVSKDKVGGIAAQAAKTKNPLQLINPFAPPEYGSGSENVARDPATGRPMGLKVVSFKF